MEKQALFAELNQLWLDEELELDSTLDEVRSIGDTTNDHLPAPLLEEWVKETRDVVCNNWCDNDDRHFNNDCIVDRPL